MTREAAVLGTPTVSIFAGRPAAVDRWLEDQGKMRIARTIDQVMPELPLERVGYRRWIPDEAVTPRFVELLLSATGGNGCLR